MSEEPNEEVNEIQARVASEMRFSKVWLVPVVALFIGIWMTYAHFAGLGQIIEITFVSGEGIQAGTTKVRRKNVEVGEVLDLRLSEDSECIPGLFDRRTDRHFRPG
jgi:paraquat-inducible protein B